MPAAQLSSWRVRKRQAQLQGPWLFAKSWFSSLCPTLNARSKGRTREIGRSCMYLISSCLVEPCMVWSNSITRCETSYSTVLFLHLSHSSFWCLILWGFAPPCLFLFSLPLLLSDLPFLFCFPLHLPATIPFANVVSLRVEENKAGESKLGNRGKGSYEQRSGKRRHQKKVKGAEGGGQNESLEKNGPDNAEKASESKSTVTKTLKKYSIRQKYCMYTHVSWATKPLPTSDTNKVSSYVAYSRCGLPLPPLQ